MHGPKQSGRFDYECALTTKVSTCCLRRELGHDDPFPAAVAKAKEDSLQYQGARHISTWIRLIINHEWKSFGHLYAAVHVVSGCDRLWGCGEEIALTGDWTNQRRKPPSRFGCG